MVLRKEEQVFKRYSFKYKGRDKRTHCVEFYLKTKMSCVGVSHNAIAIGEIPRLDDCCDNYLKYKSGTFELNRKRKFKMRARDFELWPGQRCLEELWDRLASVKFVDMGRVLASGNPFSGPDEPECEELIDPDDIFNI